LAAVTVAPTIIANARRIGTPSIANSASFNIWVGLNDVGRESFRHDIVWPEFKRWRASAETHVERNRIVRQQIRDLVRDRGITAVVRNQLSKQYFRLFDAGCYLMDQLPGGVAYESGRAGYFGIGGDLGRALSVGTRGSIVVLLVVAPVGLVFGRGSRRWIRTLVLFLLYNLALFLWLHVKTRYRIQMLPAAFVGVGCLVAWAEAGWRPPPSVARACGAVVLVAVLIWFALG
jgi:hypothetical protein